MDSLKVNLKKLRFLGKITNEEYESLIKKLDGHDEQIRVDEINRFQEWFLKTKQYCDYPEDIEWVMEKYREYIKGERNNE